MKKIKKFNVLSDVIKQEITVFSIIKNGMSTKLANSEQRLIAVLSILYSILAFLFLLISDSNTHLGIIISLIFIVFVLIIICVCVIIISAKKQDDKLLEHEAKLNVVFGIKSVFDFFDFDEDNENDRKEVDDMVRFLKAKREGRKGGRSEP